MAQISAYVSAPYQGVSQAPPQVRLPENATALEDALVAIPQGATKRPPFTYMGGLYEHSGDPTGIMTLVGREGAADILLTITNDAGVVTPRLYSMTSFPTTGGVAPQVPLTVTPAAQAYLNQGNPTPEADLRVLTVADYTFITNRKVTVGTTSDEAPDRNPEGIIWVRQAAYGRRFTVTVTPEGGSPVTVSLKTPTGKDAEDSDWVDTDVIANALKTGTYTTVNGASITGSLDSLPGFMVTVLGSVIYLTHSADFTVATEDGQGGQGLIAVKDRAQAFADLPKNAVDGFTVRLTQTSGTDEDDFYVRFESTAGGNTGVWVETIAPGANLGLDPEDMPVGLVPDGLGGWTIDTLPWLGRTTGDEELSPDPDFVGRTIQDLTFWRGRLAVISGEGVTLSNASNPFRLYPTTLSSVLEDDSIVLLSPYPDISTLRYGIPFDERLIVFGDIAQVQVTADGTLGPETARIDVMTTYEFSQAIRPQPSNGKLYFGAPKGSTASTIYELQVDRVSNVTDAEDMTTAIPRYVPGTINRAASCPVNYFMAYGTSGSGTLYPHLFRYAESQRVQNAFMRWHLPESMVLGGMFFRNTELWLLAIEETGKPHLVMVDLAPDLLDPDSERIRTHLDFALTEEQVTLSYSAQFDRTVVTLPYDVPADRNYRVVSRAPGGVGGPSLTEDGPGPAPEGMQADILWDEMVSTDSNELILNGDWTQCPLYLGFSYAMRIKLSRLYAMGGDSRPIRSGRLSIRRLAVDIANTGYLRCEVTAIGRQTRRYEFQGYRYDDPQSIYNVSPDATLVFRIPVSAENEQVEIEFVNDSHFGSKLLGFEWRGELVQKASRIT